MKVAKTKEEMAQIKSKEERDACYKEYDKKTDLEDGKYLWVEHEFKETIEIDGRKAYEQFCCGFLHFYDTEVRNNFEDHAIHFKWGKKGNNNFVQIFLDPAPLKVSKYVPPGHSASDPPPPQGPPPPPQSV